MNKKILLSSVLALTISLTAISSVKATNFGPTPPPGPNTGDDQRIPEYIYTIQIGINSPDSVKVGEPIRFESNIISDLRNKQCITSYSWDFSDGETSSDKNVSRVFHEPGTYTVNLRIDALENPGCYPTALTKYRGTITKTIIVE